MSFPLDERFRNLEQRVGDWEQQQRHYHSIEDPHHHGIVREVVINGNAGSGSCGTSGAYIAVAPLPPFNSGNGRTDGHLDFDRSTKDVMEGINSDTGVVRVYPVNVPHLLLKLLYNKGDVIEYWEYNGTAEMTSSSRGNEENPDFIRGSFVTRLVDWSFWGKIVYDAEAGGRHRYTFTAYYWQSDGSASNRWQIYTPCSGQNFTGQCYSMTDALALGPIHNQQLARITRRYKSSTSPYYEYWFNPVAPNAVFPVTLTQTSGSAGNKTTPVSFVYTVKDLSGNSLATGKTPEWPSRSENGLKTAATKGLAYYDNSSTLVLTFAYEKAGTGGCS